MAVSEVSTGTTQDVREWRELLARHADMSCVLERELQAEHQLGMSEFEVLERLAEIPERSGKVQKLAGAVHLSQSALSRVISRLETAGLVERTICPEDRRAVNVLITSAGLKRHAQAQPTQRRVLAERLHAPVQKSCAWAND